jgi:hypothetical protein
MALMDNKKYDLTNKTGHELPNLCFVAILVTRQDKRSESYRFCVILYELLTKTKQRYIFLLTQRRVSSYLLFNLIFIGVFAR